MPKELLTDFFTVFGPGTADNPWPRLCFDGNWAYDPEDNILYQLSQADHAFGGNIETIRATVNDLE